MPTQKLFPPPDGRKVYAKIRVSDGAILSRTAHWPRAVDDEPLVGDDGSTKYLPVLEDAEPTEYDSDLLSVVVTEEVGATEFLIKRDLVKRSPEELKARVANYEALHRSELVPPQELSRLLSRALAVVVKHAKLQTPTAEETKDLEAFLTIQAKLEANTARQKELVTQIDANLDPDIKQWPSRKP